MNIVKCINCNGTGRVPLELGGGKKAKSHCPVCKGRKELAIPDGKKLCPECLGAKKIPVKIAGLPYKETCGTCNGTGRVDA